MNTISINQQATLDFQGNESFKTLRSNIQFCGNTIKIIGLTSCLPGEGKSSVSFYLATSLAATGKKVILVDADLRKSVFIGRYKIDSQLNGLSHYLSGMISVEELIYQSNIINLDLLFCGPTPPNPTELLATDNFASLMEQLRQPYDYIIVDTPPVGSIIDAAVISRVCDGMVLVIQSNSLSYKFVKKVKNQLDKTGCRILGAVLNKVTVNKKGYYGKYYR
jgi:capsular exopolysaccharide synthesis family protein